MYSLIVGISQTLGVLFELHFTTSEKALKEARLIWIHLAPEWQKKVHIFVIEVKQMEPPIYGECIFDISPDNPLELED